MYRVVVLKRNFAGTILCCVAISRRNNTEKLKNSCVDLLGKVKSLESCVRGNTWYIDTNRCFTSSSLPSPFKQKTPFLFLPCSSSCRCLNRWSDTQTLTRRDEKKEQENADQPKKIETSIHLFSSSSVTTSPYLFYILYRTRIPYNITYEVGSTITVRM